MSRATSIIIADSSPLFRLGLRTILDQNERYTVLSEAESESELLQMLPELEPDLLILDCLAPGFSIDTVLQCSRVSAFRPNDRDYRFSKWIDNCQCFKGGHYKLYKEGLQHEGSP